MLEIRTFDGGPEELAALANRVWRESYAGRMPAPLWGERFLRRELLCNADGDRELIVAAYDGSQLVGVHPARPIRIRLRGQELSASWGSFLTVDPAWRRQGVARQMIEESIARHRARGAVANFGFLYIRSSRSMGPKFWLRESAGPRLVRKLGMWVRPIDHATVARFELYPAEAWGTRLLSLVHRGPLPPTNMEGIRLYRHGDLADCRTLWEDASRGADLAYLWDDDSLDRQLGFAGVGRTVVLVKGEQVAGLVNYTLLNILGRIPMTVALVDGLALGALPWADRYRLLRAAINQISADGAKAVLVLRGSWQYARELLATGFLPFPPEYYYVATPTCGEASFEKIGRVHVLWR